jgi:hypothetical protein
VVTARRVLVALAGAALAVGGVLALGGYLRDTVPARGRHHIAVTDIDCDPPAGKTRTEFLGEVHYYGRLPEQLDAADPALPDRLREAFAKHPKVRRVEKVTVAPPDKVRVDVVYH